MIIRFSEDFHKYTNFHECIEVEGRDVSECMVKTFNRFPQLMLFLSAKNQAEAGKTSIKLNGDFIFEPSDLWIEVGELDELEFGRDIPEGESAGAKMIVGAVMIVAAIALSPYTAGTSLSWLPQGLGMLGASLALGGLSELIAGRPALPGDVGTSPTYSSFSGIQNTTTPGTPIGIVYGKHRVGGHIVNAYTEVVNEVNSYLNAQIALSEGEIESISDVELNSRSFTGYQDVSLFWRSGTSDQDPLTPLSTEYTDGKDEYILPSAYPLTTKGVSIPAGYTITLPAGTTQIRIKFKQEGSYYLRLDGLGYTLSVRLWLEDQNNEFIPYRGFPVTKNTIEYEKTLQVWPTPTTPTTYHIKGSGWVTETSKAHWVDLLVLAITVENTNYANMDKASAMWHFGEIRNTQSINQLITNQTVASDSTLQGGAEYITQTQSNKVYLSVTAPAMFSNGGSATASVDFKIGLWRVGDNSNTPTYYKDPANNNSEIFTIKHSKGTTSEIFKTVQVNLPLPMDYWRIVVWRVTPDHSGDILIADTIYLGDVTESSPGGQIYPHTALLGVSIRATDQISGSMPTITSLVKGVKVSVPTGYSGYDRLWLGDWDGTLAEEKQWTDNPVWCLYDLITNKRYGFGDYFKLSDVKRGLMLHNLVEMANYCDVIVKDDGTITEDTTDTTARCRFSLNLVIDEFKSAIEWLNIICASMRASLFYTEGAVYIDIDRAKNVSQLFTMSSISEYSQSRASRSEVPNTYEVQFLDANSRYETTILSVEDPAFQADPTLEQRSKTLQLRGVTDEKQARSLTKYALYGGKYARTFVSFKTGTQGLRTMVGDVIGVQHDVPRWGEAGRVVSCKDLGASYQLELADEVTLGAYEYQICLARAGKEPEFADVIEEAGTSNFVTIVKSEALTIVPEKGDEFILGLTTNSVKTFRVLSLKRDKDDLVEVSAVEYVPSLYADCDNITVGSGGVTYTPYKSIEEPVRVSVANITVRANTYLDSSGVYKTGAIINYTIPADVNWKGAVVYYGLENYSTMLPVNTTGTVEIKEISESGAYYFAVASTYADGTRQSLREAPYVHVDLTATNPVSPEFLSGVSGLTIENKGNDSEFLGKDCVVTWYRPLVYNPDIAAGDEVAGASTTQTNNLFSHYVVDVLNSDESVRRSTKVTKETYTYTHEMNHADVVVRTFAVSVTAVDIYGRSSEPATIICTNPAPPALF